MALRISTSITFVAMAFSILACRAQAAPSDSQVADIINKSWNVCQRFRLGNSAVGNQVMNAQLMSDSELNLLRAASRAGLVVLTEGPDTPPTNMFLTGVIKQISVVPSAAGLEASKNSNCETTDPQFLRVELAAYRVDKIISNEETKNAVDTFRVVKGTAKVALTNAGIRFYQELHMPTSSPGIKFIKLLKFDSFTGQWKVVATDQAAIDSDFKNDSVQRYLTGAGH